MTELILVRHDWYFFTRWGLMVILIWLSGYLDRSLKDTILDAIITCAAAILIFLNMGNLRLL